MASQSLAAHFALHRISAGVFSIGGEGVHHNVHVLRAEANKWHVYYFTDDVRQDERMFEEEADACAELRRRVVTNPHHFL